MDLSLAQGRELDPLLHRGRDRDDGPVLLLVSHCHSEIGREAVMTSSDEEGREKEWVNKP